MKLSELKAKLGELKLDVNLDEIEDDETGQPVKALRHSQKSYTQETQKRAQIETALKERDTQLQTLQGQHHEATTRAAQLEGVAQELQRRAASTGTDWRKDPLYEPLVEEFNRVTTFNAKVVESYNNLLTAHQDAEKRYQTDRAFMLNFVRKSEIRDMKAKYTDFDEDKVTEAAKKYGINDWEGAYRASKGDSVDATIEAERTKARDEGMKLAEDKLKAPATEMGTGPGAPAIDSKPAEYDSAWKGLVGEFQRLGVA